MTLNLCHGISLSATINQPWRPACMKNVWHSGYPCVMERDGPFQHQIKYHIVISQEVSNPRDWMLVCSYRFEIWQATRQQCCRDACQISERLNYSRQQSRACEILRDFTDIETASVVQRNKPCTNHIAANHSYSGGTGSTNGRRGWLTPSTNGQYG